MENNLQRQNLTLVGIILPSVWVGTLVFLILISFMSSKISSIIAADSLILLTLIFSPIVCITGATISIIALATSKMKKRPFWATGLNIALLVFWLYFNKSFLMELELIS